MGREDIVTRHCWQKTWQWVALLCLGTAGCSTLSSTGKSLADTGSPVDRPSRKAEPTVIRGQQPYQGSELWSDYPTSGGSNTMSRPRQPMPVSAPSSPTTTSAVPSSTTTGSTTSTWGQPVRTAQQPAPATTPYASPLPPPPTSTPSTSPPLMNVPPAGTAGNGWIGDPAVNGGAGLQPVMPNGLPAPKPADVIIDVQEAQTGRFQFGAGINSDAGFSFQAVLDEQNFDWKKFPRSMDDVVDGRAFRGDGQRLRIEAMPGNQVERYLFNWTDPFFRDTPVSLNLSGFLFDRKYYDWDERRIGGRVGFGYRLTPDISIATAFRAEQVEISQPRVTGVPELDAVLGYTDLYGAKLTLTHDTRDRAFAATEGHFLEMSFEQVFGDYIYPRANLDYRRYFLLNERPDGSGRHTLGNIWQFGITGSDTPIFENFFAGGYSTLRGFRFRGASPQVDTVTVGGEFMFLGSLEYMFPITADDMFKGVIFTDYGTVEQTPGIDWADFRVAVGAGLRITIPAMGPAPIAVDFAIPLNKDETDRVQNISFFVGVGR